VTGLPELLERAAGDGRIGFDSSDVAHRVRRHARRQRLLLTAAVFLVVVGVGITAVAALTRVGSDSPLVDGPDPAVTLGELTAAVWVSDPRSDEAGVSVSFRDDGRLLVVEGGCVATGRWRVDADLLVVDDPAAPFGGCETDDEMTETLLGSPTIVRPEGPGGPMALDDPTGSVALERVDRVGRAPTSAFELVGDWQPPTGSNLRLSADLRWSVGPDDCVGTWSLEGDQLTLSPSRSRPQGTCELLALTSEGDDLLDGTSTVRLVGDDLVLATSESAITFLGPG
jgi:hypothetical protein